jgi:tRNA (cytidine/uridine-2'-O-)-methyltransferase
MDYAEKADITLHRDWDTFTGTIDSRLVLLTTRSDLPYTAFAFARDDILLVGRESAGVPEDVHARADARITIPMAAGLRSLNVAVAAAMVMGEALRQTDQFPKRCDTP